MAKGMRKRHTVILAMIASFAIYMSPLPTHGSATTIGLLFWQDGRWPTTFAPTMAS